jgi:hypothetical protein
VFVARLEGWRSVNFITRCAFFVLGMIVAGTVFSICHLLHLGNGALAAGLILVAAGEWLIISRRLVFSGIEEAFELAGLLMLSFEMIDALGSSSEALIALFAGCAFAVAGFRLLSPFLSTVALLALAAAFEFAIDKPGMSIRNAPIWTGMLCYAVAWLSLGMGGIHFVRPSYDRMLSWLVVAMPLAGYLWLAGGHNFNAVDYLHDASLRAALTPLLPLAFAVTALIIGVQRRTHAPLIAGLICIACVAFELRRLTGLSLEMRLMIWGAIALAIAIALDRVLRIPRAGVTSEKLRDGAGTLELLELAGAAVIARRDLPEQTSSIDPGDGRFGGGGARGKY